VIIITSTPERQKAKYFGWFFEKSIAPKSLGRHFSEKMRPKDLKVRPNGKITPILVTLSLYFKQPPHSFLLLYDGLPFPGKQQKNIIYL
jgi:hypothetical protein